MTHTTDNEGRRNCRVIRPAAAGAAPAAQAARAEPRPTLADLLKPPPPRVSPSTFYRDGCHHCGRVQGERHHRDCPLTAMVEHYREQKPEMRLVDLYA